MISLDRSNFNVKHVYDSKKQYQILFLFNMNKILCFGVWCSAIVSVNVAISPPSLVKEEVKFNTAATIVKPPVTTVTPMITVMPNGTAAEVTDYCDPMLCRKYTLAGYVLTEHIACKNDNKFNNSSCPKQRGLVPMTDSLKILILKMHNRYRNSIAKGEVENYQPAAKMPIMQWDKELAYFAELHVKRCTFEHDECRNTKKYLFAGQNLGITWTTAPTFPEPLDAIKNLTRDWFAEYKFASQEIIDKYGSIRPKEPIGHFTLMVTDRSDRVGCGLSKFKQEKKNTYLFTCVYSFTNLVTQPIYIKGKTGHLCKTGTHQVYTGLCSTNETVFASPFAD